MRTTQISQQLHDYKLNIAQKEKLDKRFTDHQNGVGKTFTWDETVAIAEQALKERKNYR